MLIIKKLIFDYYYSGQIHNKYKQVLDIYNKNFVLNSYNRLLVQDYCIALERSIKNHYGYIYMWPSFTIFCNFMPIREKYERLKTDFVPTVILPKRYWYTWPLIEDLRSYVYI